MSVITNKWNDGSGDSINIESPSFQGNQTVKISSPVQKGTSKRSMKFIGKCKKDSSKQVILTVEQEASTYTYDLTLNSDNTEIAAKGGTATITAVLKTYRNGNLVSTDNVTPVLSGSATGFSISGTKVTASNRGISAGAERSITVTAKFSDTFDGQTVSSTIVIKQSENYITSLKIGGGSTSKFLPPTLTYSAAGGSNPFTGWVVYSSGTQANVDTWRADNWILSQSYFTKSIADGILTVTGEYRGITIGAQRSGTLTLSLNSVSTNNKTIETSLTLTQAANEVTTVSYGNINITYFIYPDIPAAGGSVNPKLAYTQAKIQNYSSGGSKNIGTISSGATLTYGKNGTSGSGGINATTGVVSVGTRGTTIGNRWEVGSFFVNIKLNGKEKSVNVVCYQEANEESIKSTSGGVYTYGNVVAGVISNKTIPASGGSATATAGNGTQNWNKSAKITTYQYTSGATKDVITENASSGTNNVAPSIASINATASSKGTTISAQTIVKSQNFGWYANGKSASGTMYIYQEANAVIDDNYNEHLSSYGTPEIRIAANQITAAGGTARAAGVVRNTYTYYDLYTSGITVPHTRTKAGVYKIEMISNGNNRFSMDSTYLITHSSMGTNVTTDTATFRCYNEGDRTKYVDESISVSNRIESYNYGSWNISISANPTSLPATGGTSTITSSCTRSKTPVYTSGSTGTATTESATPTLSLTTNPGGFTLSGNKLTAANNPIGAKTATVTASYSGATSKSVSVSQAAGPDGIGYMQIEGDGKSHPIFRVGNTTRSIEPTSVNQNSNITSDKDSSIFASLKQLLFKFI